MSVRAFGRPGFVPLRPTDPTFPNFLFDSFGSAMLGHPQTKANFKISKLDAA